MGKKGGTGVVLHFCVNLLLLGLVTAEYVPVLMWGALQEKVEVPALNKLNSEQFIDILKRTVGKDTPVIVFAEPTLSPEDLATEDESGKHLFEPIFGLTDEVKQDYLPQVKNSIEAVKTLPNRHIVEISINSLGLNNKLDYSNNEILIINLNDAKDEDDRTSVLQRHVDRILSIYKSLKEKSPIVILTAHHPSWILPEDVQIHRRARATDETENDTRILYKNENILLFVTNVPMYSHNGNRYSLKDYDVETTEKSNGTLRITMKNSENAKNPVFELSFKFSGGYWYFPKIKVKTESDEISVEARDIYAPEGFSYHCSKQAFYLASSANTNISFPGLQIEPFLSKNDTSFGDAYDCIGFMSVPIWSGLFVTFILVAIITLGLSMMMSIRTMDRFDDPKGKTITINVSE